MVFIECCEKYFVLAADSRVTVFGSGEPFDQFELKLPEFKVDGDPHGKSLANNKSSGEDNPVCGRFSRDGGLFAVSDVYKRLIIWRTGDLQPSVGDQNNPANGNDDRSWEIKRILSTDKRAVQLSFLGDNSLLVGDKSCDVYKYDLETGEGTLLFGHISMLLAMKVCPREKFIVTCDRDEKVRVTNYPSVYNIQTYLLGHREFVSSCAFIDDQHVLTGSGDSQIKLWNIIDGKELCSVDLSVDLAAKLAVNGGHPAKERDGGGAVDDRNEPASNEPAKNESDRPAGSESTNEAVKADDRLAIKRVFCIRSSLIVVAFFNLPNLVTFVIEPGLQLVRNAIIELPSNLLDAIEHGDRLYLLTAADGLISYEAQGNQLVRLDGDRFLASINANQELFKFNEKELTSFRLLYKLPSGIDEAEPNDDRDARKRKRSN